MTGKDELSRRLTELERGVSSLEAQAQARGHSHGPAQETCGHCSGSCSNQDDANTIEQLFSPDPKEQAGTSSGKPGKIPAKYRVAQDVKDAITRESPLHGIVMDVLIARGEWEVYDQDQEQDTPAPAPRPRGRPRLKGNKGNTG